MPGVVIFETGQGYPHVMDATSIFDLVGGQPWFDKLVDQFYTGVASDELLLPMYPDDLVESRRTLAMFLAQYWGGPPLYNNERGHPRLRMRHVPFQIGVPERDAWLKHMLAALDTMAPHELIAEAMTDYFSMAATQMVNHFPEAVGGDRSTIPVS